MCYETVRMNENTATEKTTQSRSIETNNTDVQIEKSGTDLLTSVAVNEAVAA
jgi:hypothetical protein